MVSLFNSIHVV